MVDEANNSTLRSRLKTGNYDTYALYFVKYVTQMKNKEIVLIVLNDSGSNKYFNINLGEEAISSSLKDGAVGTYLISL